MNPHVISSILIPSIILRRGFLSAIRQTTINCFFSLRSKLIYKIIWTRTYGFIVICPISRIGRCSSLKTRVISEFASLIGYHYLCRISLMLKRDLAKVKLRVRFSYLAPIVRMSGKANRQYPKGWRVRQSSRWCSCAQAIDRKWVMNTVGSNPTTNSIRFHRLTED